MLCDENGTASKVAIKIQEGKRVRIFKKTQKLIS
jgi:uncharacterized protein YgiM (DUF1202 family)